MAPFPDSRLCYVYFPALNCSEGKATDHSVKVTTGLCGVAVGASGVGVLDVDAEPHAVRASPNRTSPLSPRLRPGWVIGPVVGISRRMFVSLCQ